MKRKNEFDEWLSGLTAFQLPRWQELSAVTLYMDQLINTVEKHLTVFGLGRGEKLSITPAMVNNYVNKRLFLRDLVVSLKTSWPLQIYCACLATVRVLVQLLLRRQQWAFLR
jgi:hypothetical protein